MAGIYINRKLWVTNEAGLNFATVAKAAKKKNPEISFLLPGGALYSMSPGDYVMVREGMRFAVVEKEKAIAGK